MFVVGHLDQVDMIRKFRQRTIISLNADAPRRPVRRQRAGPVGLEAEFSARMRKAAQEMRFLEIRLNVRPAFLLEGREASQPGLAEDDVNVLLFGQSEARQMRDAKPLAKFLDHIMVRARALRWVDQFRPKDDVLVSAAT